MVQDTWFLVCACMYEYQINYLFRDKKAHLYVRGISVHFRSRIPNLYFSSRILQVTFDS